MHVLVTGATGYIGGRLVPRLLQRGHSVRVMVRDPNRIAGRPWIDRVEVVRGDLSQPHTLDGMFDGIEVAYYLVHSMYAGSDYAQRDRRAAENFCKAAAGVQHVIYLGGLLPQTPHVSRHLRSRAEVGRILGEHLPTTELRAGPIIGSGSASFELLRYMTDRLPVMIAPSWVHNQVQPIAVRDVLMYLVLALQQGPSGIVAIGADPITFKQMIEVYAQANRLRRWIISVPPVLPTWLAAGWLGWVTPIPRRVAVALIEGVSRPLTINDSRANELFPQVKPIACRQAVQLAMQRIAEQAVETHWSGALADAPTYELRDWEGLIREVRTTHVDAEPEAVFRVFSGLGGQRGWLVWNWIWVVRGAIDRMFGGPGLRRGRRDPQALLPGEAVDFWRVEVVEPPHLLRLRAEMKLPGLAWLQWEVTAENTGTRLIQTAAFLPHGLPGALYWYMLYPLHRIIFSKMVKAIGHHAHGQNRIEM